MYNTQITQKDLQDLQITMNSGQSNTRLNDMLTNFVEYVDSFYGVNDPLYPMVNKETGQVSQTFSDSYFEFFLEENVSDLLNSERNRSNLEDIID